MDVIYGLAVGIGLSAACGFRIFIPLLLLSLASLGGYVDLADRLAWVGTYPALVAFAVAAVVEVLAYFIPWVDNLLDSIASPLAVVAGVGASASMLGDLPPLMQWSLAAIGGGGVAGLVQSGTVLARGTSSGTTGGAGNILVAAVELVASIATSLLALIAPALAVLAVLVLCVILVRQLLRRRRLHNPEMRYR